MRVSRTLAVLAVGAALAAGTSYAAARPSAPSAPTAGSQLAQIRAATAAFHDLDAAKAAGWNVPFQDINGLSCIEDLSTPSQGGMGYHWVNPDNIGSTDPAEPAAVIYAGKNKRLVGVEYLVPDPTGTTPMPMLNGQDFMYTPAGNRFLGPTAFWSLHVWAWDPSPSGIYSMWNPRISCP